MQHETNLDMIRCLLFGINSNISESLLETVYQEMHFVKYVNYADRLNFVTIHKCAETYLYNVINHVQDPDGEVIRALLDKDSYNILINEDAIDIGLKQSWGSDKDAVWKFKVFKYGESQDGSSTVSNPMVLLYGDKGPWQMSMAKLQELMGKGSKLRSRLSETVASYPNVYDKILYILSEQEAAIREAYTENTKEQPAFDGSAKSYSVAAEKVIQEILSMLPKLTLDIARKSGAEDWQIALVYAKKYYRWEPRK